jgi:hypothetical protein
MCVPVSLPEADAGVNGGVNMVENRRFKIPEKRWHDPCFPGG